MAARKKQPKAPDVPLPVPKTGWEIKRGVTPFETHALYTGRQMNVLVHGHITDKTKFFLTCHALNISLQQLKDDTWLEGAMVEAMDICSKRMIALGTELALATKLLADRKEDM